MNVEKDEYKLTRKQAKTIIDALTHFASAQKNPDEPKASKSEIARCNYARKVRESISTQLLKNERAVPTVNFGHYDD